MTLFWQGLLRAKGARTALPTFAAAGIAGAASSAVLYPLEVVRSRLTCDTVHIHPPYAIVTVAVSMQAHNIRYMSACAVYSQICVAKEPHTEMHITCGTTSTFWLLLQRPECCMPCLLLRLKRNS